MEKELIVKEWGQFSTFMRNHHCVMKEITVNQGQAISYQYHNHRNEFWYIAFGTGVVTINGMDFEASHGDTFVILAKDKHRIRNTGKTKLTIFEMQYGPKCYEDDIVRLKDDYGRC